MAKGDFSVDVYAMLRVPDETVDRCLRLLEMWLEDNPEWTIVAEKKYENEDGKATISMRRERFHEP